MSTIIPVILSGGSGTRLWPLSRKHYPKQLLNLAGGQYTMLQQTALRVQHLSAPIVVCNEDHRFMVAEQLRALSEQPATIILEPLARNTAPAIALAALAATEQDPEAIIAVFPADHVINNQAVFEQALEKATEAACSGDLLTFGIVPSEAETGYGYIKAQAQNGELSAVEQFVEKPCLQDAEAYVQSGQYFWNSGMFVFKAQAYLDALEALAPTIKSSCQAALAQANSDLDFIRVDKAAFAQCPDLSIDYAVMEHASNVKMVPMDAGWSDVGSWSALWQIADKDSDDNAFIGEVMAIDSSGNLVHSAEKLVAIIGLDNVVVVDTKDALLVCDKSQVQRVKEIVAELKQQSRPEHLLHREVHRPWGCYDAIDSDERYQVKRIKVKPGASLSLQMHHHRSEHWVVVKGTAKVQLGEKTLLLTENQSVYIPIGEKHRLTNPGKIPLELIEVQSGDYLGEDDIVRFEDLYRRD